MELLLAKRKEAKSVPEGRAAGSARVQASGGHGGQPEGEIQSVKSLMRDSVDEIARRSEERRMRPVEGGALD